MTTTRLPRIGQTIKEQPSKPEEDVGVKANTSEALKLYQRGVAAARGGQKRIAAGLLTRSVQHDPNNESAWLWLSGVIDDPHQIAFCLNSVLKLNPGNERARKGLRWLEERQLLKGEPRPAPLLNVRVGEAPVVQQERAQQESWWVNWRQSWNASRHVTMLLWSVPIILLFLALVINQAFALAVEQAQTRPDIPSLSQQSAPSEVELVPPQEPATPVVSQQPTVVPILNTAPASLRQSETVAYLNMLHPIREDLQSAVETYRNATGQPGNTAIAHTSATQKFREEVEQAHATLSTMEPPQVLQSAHETYIEGLSLELAAIDALGEFYGSYKTEYANLAAVRFQDADAHFARARALFDAKMYEIEVNGAMSVHTVQ